ncbi:MAG TPA: ATPase domain-containing protein [Thermoplasmata archaeon]|nr:ATPase domain-containing protein [Thermoplasmata archaeon]
MWTARRAEGRTPGTGRLRTFVEGFDEALEGGIPRGHVVLVAGPSGSLKTTLCLQMVARHRAQGTPGLYLSLEESRESLTRTLQRLGLGAEGDFIVDVGRMRLEHEAAQDARDWFSILRDYLQRRTEREPIGLLVIDPVNSLYSLSAMENPRRELFEFFAFLKGLGITSLLVCESEENEVAFRHQEDFLADGTLTLSFRDASGRVDLVLRCAKMRHTLHSRDPYRITLAGGTLTASPVGSA